jgi:hypothetical protein
MIVASVATVFILMTAFLVYRNRTEPSIRYAQVDFLGMLLCGSFFIGVGSILLSAPASDGTCLASMFMVNVGYTLELVPLILKVAAINRLMQAARELRRVDIKRTLLYKSVAAICLLLLIYLGTWSALNPPQQEIEYSMTGETTETGDWVVGKTYFCSNGDGTNAWQFVAVAWNAVLLLCASVLAFQTRNVIQQFNESRTLAVRRYRVDEKLDCVVARTLPKIVFV